MKTPRQGSASIPFSSAARSCVGPRRRPVWAATRIPLAATRDGTLTRATGFSGHCTAGQLLPNICRYRGRTRRCRSRDSRRPVRLSRHSGADSLPVAPVPLWSAMPPDRPPPSVRARRSHCLAKGPAMIQRRGNSWRARYHGPDGRERNKSFKRKADAERWLSQQRFFIAQGDWTELATVRPAARLHGPALGRGDRLARLRYRPQPPQDRCPASILRCRRPGGPWHSEVAPVPYGPDSPFPRHRAKGSRRWETRRRSCVHRARRERHAAVQLATVRLPASSQPSRYERPVPHSRPAAHRCLADENRQSCVWCIIRQFR